MILRKSFISYTIIMYLALDQTTILSAIERQGLSDYAFYGLPKTQLKLKSAGIVVNLKFNVNSELFDFYEMYLILQ